jgi:hypothetical protein
VRIYSLLFRFFFCARFVARAEEASRSATTVVAEATDAVRSACDESNGMWRRIAVHASEACRRTVAHASPGDDGAWWRTLFHASITGFGRRTIAAPTPPTSARTTAAIAMRRTFRRVPKFGRNGPPPGLAAGFPEIGRELGAAGRAGGPGRKLRHASQTPLSPASGVYKAPHVEHPTTEDGVFMPWIVPDQAAEIPCGSVRRTRTPAHCNRQQRGPVVPHVL